MPQTRINQRIRARELRLVAEDGEQLGVVSREEALRLAEESGVDLVEVAPNAEPPVCRLMDYGKFKYEAKKQTAQKKQKTQLLKEITFRPNIGDHDFEVKLSRIREFLGKGHKTKVRVFFRGREIIHSDRGRLLAQRVVEDVVDIGTVDVPPKIEGKNLIMILSPLKKD